MDTFSTMDVAREYIQGIYSSTLDTIVMSKTKVPLMNTLFQKGVHTVNLKGTIEEILQSVYPCFFYSRLFYVSRKFENASCYRSVHSQSAPN